MVKDHEFHNLAHKLLQETTLLVAGRVHRIREIEFYFTSQRHCDPFTHCHPLQSENGFWYFHRMSPTSNSYKGGSFKGLDVTIGNGTDAGGILIRSIERIDTGEIICGPSLCVDYILSQNSSPSVSSFVTDKLQDNLHCFTDTQTFLAIQEARDQPLQQKNIIFTARIGLYFTKKDVDISLQQQYIFRLYRAVSDAFQISKGKALGIVSLLEAGLDSKDIQSKTGSNAKTIEKYSDCFLRGRNTNPDNYVGNKWSDALLCECYGSITRKYPNVYPFQNHIMEEIHNSLQPSVETNIQPQSKKLKEKNLTTLPNISHEKDEITVTHSNRASTKRKRIFFN